MIRESSVNLPLLISEIFSFSNPVPQLLFLGSLVISLHNPLAELLSVSLLKSYVIIGGSYLYLLSTGPQLYCYKRSSFPFHKRIFLLLRDCHFSIG